MKNWKTGVAYFSMLALLFTSCSKEEEVPGTDKASLSFSTLLNDFADQNSAMKQALDDLPECSDAAPAFVQVVLTGAENVGSMGDPLVVSVNPDPGNYDDDPELEYFTEESAELELEPGNYSLEFFAVWDGDPDDAESEMIWIAPHEDGSVANLVEDALPLNFNLGAGAKKYVDVGVICFDNRIVNEYGYLFFDIENRNAIEFCVFGNFCPPGGRHYPAAYTVEVWSSEGGDLIDSGTAVVALDENGDYAASPVCLMLPDTEGTDTYYGEITLQDSDAYGNIEERVIRAGTFTDLEVRSFFDGDNNLEYYHFREGCEGDDDPPIFDDPTDDVISYKACLTEVNDSNALAFAYLELEGNSLRTHVYGFNLEAQQMHMQHIHGLADNNANSTCPPESASGDDDIITFAEGLPYYGEVKLALNDESGDYPLADAMGMTEYHRTFTLGSEGIISADDLGLLENRTVVVHGMTLDEEYDPSLPVACAEIIKVN